MSETIKKGDMKNKSKSLQELRISMDYAEERYIVVAHMLKNAIGEKARANKVFEMNSREAVENLLMSFAGMNSKDFSNLIEADPDKAVKVLKKQTAQLERFLNGAENVLTITHAKTSGLSEEKQKVASKAITNEFENESNNGVLDFLDDSQALLDGVEKGSRNTDREAYIKEYATWLSGTIKDVKVRLSRALKEELAARGIGTAKSSSKKTGSVKEVIATPDPEPKKEEPKAEKKPETLSHNSGTALITAELATDINRTRALLAGLTPAQQSKVEAVAVKKSGCGTKIVAGVLGVITAASLVFGIARTVERDNLKKENDNLKKNSISIEELNKNYTKNDIIANNYTSNADVAEKYVSRDVYEAVLAKITDAGYTTIDELIDALGLSKKEATQYKQAYENLVNGIVDIFGFEKGSDMLVNLQGKANEIVDLNNKIAEKDRLIKDLEDQLAQADNGELIDKLNKRISQLEKDKTTIQQKYDKLYKDYETLSGKYDKLLENWNDFNEVLNEYGAQNATDLHNIIEQQKQALRNERDRYYQNWQTAKAERDEYYQKWQDALKNQDNGQAAEWKQKAEEWEQKANEYKGLYDSKLAECEAKDATINEQNTLISTLTQQIKDLQAENEALKANQGASQTTGGTQNNEGGAGQVSAGGEEQNDDTHVNNNGMGVGNGSGTRSGGDDDLTIYEEENGRGRR